MLIYDKANELADELKNCPENIEYQELMAKIQSNDSDKAILTEYRKLRFEVQSAYLSGGQPDQEKLDKLNKLGEVLQFNNDIAKFIAVEYKLNQLISDVYKIIGQAVGIDLDFMND